MSRVPTVAAGRRRTSLGTHAVALAALVVAWPGTATAQLQTARGLLVPLPDSVPARGVVPRVHYWLEFQRVAASLHNFTAYNYKLGAVVEIYRWKNGPAIATQLAHELYATPDNGIGFDPRGAVWEEQLALLGRLGPLAWWTSAFLRCRHEVDNGTPVAVAAGRRDAEPTSRILVLPGAQIAFSTSEISLGSRVTARLGASSEGYIDPQDRRNPGTPVTPRWSDATGSIATTGRVGVRIHPAVDGYARAWRSTVFFRDGTENTRTNSDVEVGVHVRGRGGAIDVYLARERTFDDVTLPTPRPHTGTFVGVRLASRGVF
jgi:hypothetical protein